MVMYPHEIIIREYTEQQDPNSGEYTKTWADVDTFEAEVTTPSGMEQIEAMKLNNPLDYVVHMEHDSRIKPRMRVAHQGKELDIHAVLPSLPDINGDYEALILRCSSNLR